MTKNGSTEGETARQQRLAAALRANLMKRKARDRAAPNAGTPDADSTSREP